MWFSSGSLDQCGHRGTPISVHCVHQQFSEWLQHIVAPQFSSVRSRRHSDISIVVLCFCGIVVLQYCGHESTLISALWLQRGQSSPRFHNAKCTHQCTACDAKTSNACKVNAVQDAQIVESKLCKKNTLHNEIQYNWL